MSNTLINVGVSYKTLLVGLREGLKSSELVYNLVGYSGIGKTALVREAVKDLGGEMVEINSSLLQAGDLAMPVKHELEDGTPIVKYVVNEIITKINREAKENPGKIHVIFLDEVNRSDAEVQADLMNLILQREIFDVKLEPNVRIVTAQNPDRTTEGFEGTNYDVHEVDEATASRVVDVRMRYSVQDWLEYGNRRADSETNRRNVHPMVTAFISNGNEDKILEYDTDKRNTPSPRSWSRVGDLLYSFGISDFSEVDEDIYNFVGESITGTVGQESATNFLAFGETFTDYIKVEEWLNATDAEFEELLERYKEYDNTKRVYMAEQLVETMLESKVNASNTHIQKRTVNVLNLAPVDTITHQMDKISSKFYDIYEGEHMLVDIVSADGTKEEENLMLGMIKFTEFTEFCPEIEDKMDATTENMMLGVGQGL